MHALTQGTRRDDRGHFKEPHRGKTFGLGTLNVRDYLQGNVRPVMEEAGFKDAEIKTHGPDGRFGAVLFIEKEGFAPIFEAANLAEKFDIAIMSSKGMSVTAARMLVDRMCAKCDIPLLTLHDFDIAGFSIGKTVGSDTRRYSFRNRIRVVDLGLRLAVDDNQQCPSDCSYDCPGSGSHDSMSIPLLLSTYSLLLLVLLLGFLSLRDISENHGHPAHVAGFIAQGGAFVFNGKARIAPAPEHVLLDMAVLAI